MWCTNRLLWHTNSDFHGIRTPTFTPYEPVFIGLGVVFNILKVRTPKEASGKRFRTRKEASGRRLSAGRHAQGSEASSWVAALELDKVAGLGCSSVPVLCHYYILFLNFCEPRHGKHAKQAKDSKKKLQDQNPFRDTFWGNSNRYR